MGTLEVASRIAADLRADDLFELTDPFEHTFDVCESLAEAVRHAPDYGCERIDVLRPTGKTYGGFPVRETVHVLDLATAREVIRLSQSTATQRARQSSPR